MGMTIAEKILARASGATSASAGEIVMAAVDMSVIDDVQFLHFFKAWKKLGGRIHDPEHVCAIADHYGPPSDVDQAETVRQLREFGLAQNLPYCFINTGIKHQVLMEAGLAGPGTVITCTDSHTNTMGAVGAFATPLGPTEVAAIWREGRIWFKVPNTIRIEMSGQMPRGVYAKDIALHLLGSEGANFAQYRALEFGGPAVQKMGMSERQTLANMSTEMGAKVGIVECDSVTEAFAARTSRPYFVDHDDGDAHFERVIEVDISKLEPLVAVPHSPSNARSISSVEGKRIHQAFLGTCTNGNFEDLAIAAEILRGHHIAPGVQMVVTPASAEIYARAVDAGIIGILARAGALVTNANCGACAGTHQGVLAKGEVRISSQNRNFRGRGGHLESEIYLASPATVAASALTGVISDPRKFLA
jgi:3-isopropylmalate/(R)-2-methylmalate dehydratase large subunit